MSIRNMMIGGAGLSPPGAPTGVSATSLGVVSFSAPAENGGSAITSFTVTSSPGGVTASGASSPITVTGLSDGTSYTFTVTATNAIGTGAASAASSAITYSSSLYAFSSHTFTPAGAAGLSGPTLAMMRSTYSSTSWAATDAYFTAPYQGIQLWTVPATATYNFQLRGAYGGVGDNTESYSGRPWFYSVNIPLTAGEKILIAVGQKGGNVDPTGSFSSAGGGGGGATWVCKYVSDSNITPLVITAGGGGAYWDQWTTGGQDARNFVQSAPTAFWDGTAPFTQGRGGMGGCFDRDNRSSGTPYGTEGTFVNQQAAGLLRGGSLTSLSLRGGTGSNHLSDTDFNDRVYHAGSGSGSQPGGFGGGGGCTYEGAGGGGYWGGAVGKTNDYNVDYAAYSATSYYNVSQSVSLQSQNLYTGGDGSGRVPPSGRNSSAASVPASQQGQCVVTKL